MVPDILVRIGNGGDGEDEVAALDPSFHHRDHELGGVFAPQLYIKLS